MRANRIEFESETGRRIVLPAHTDFVLSLADLTGSGPNHSKFSVCSSQHSSGRDGNAISTTGEIPVKNDDAMSLTRISKPFVRMSSR